jgi:hypothetical protein
VITSQRGQVTQESHWPGAYYSHVALTSSLTGCKVGRAALAAHCACTAAGCSWLLARQNFDLSPLFLQGGWTPPYHTGLIQAISALNLLLNLFLNSGAESMVQQE